MSSTLENFKVCRVPNRITLIGLFPRVWYSAITWRQLPQGEHGPSERVPLNPPTMARETIALPGLDALAANIAVLSAQRPEG